MHPAELERLRQLKEQKARGEVRLELPKPMAKCPRDGTLFPLTEGVCPMCGDFA